MDKVRLLIDAGADATLQNDVDQLLWQCVQQTLENVERDVTSHPGIISLFQEAIDLLRSVAERGEISDATPPVVMTKEEEAKKAHGGRV